MKFLTKLYIHLGISFLFLILGVVLFIAYDYKWWILFLFIGLILFGNLLSFLINKFLLQKPTIQEKEQDYSNLTNKRKGTQDIVDRFRELIMYSPYYLDYVDDLKVVALETVGQEGRSPTSIGVIKGTGYYENKLYVGIIDRDNIDNFSILIDPTPEEIEQTKQRIATFPARRKVTKKIKRDEFGEPVIESEIEEQTPAQIMEEKRLREEEEGDKI